MLDPVTTPTTSSAEWCRPMGDGVSRAEDVDQGNRGVLLVEGCGVPVFGGAGRAGASACADSEVGGCCESGCIPIYLHPICCGSLIFEKLELKMASEKGNKDTRRSNKPIMEKRRRARINNCLNDLKTLILEAMKKDPARHSKLEKADILEMTVKYLQNLQRQQVAYVTTSDPNVINKYRAGFTECANEVSRYVSRLSTVDTKIRTRLINHLSACVAGLAPSSSSRLPPTKTATTVVSPVHIQIPTGPINLLPPSVDVLSGIQLVPSRLPNGEIAFLLPAASAVRSTSPAFTVSSNTSTLSPAGSDFSDGSCVSSPAPSELTLGRNHDMPQNLTVPKNLSPVENMWRPW